MFSSSSVSLYSYINTVTADVAAELKTVLDLDSEDVCTAFNQLFSNVQIVLEAVLLALGVSHVASV